MKNYYEVLEVSQNASSEVIEKAYKALAKKYHPDINPDNIQEAEKKFKEIGEAYDILSDPAKKEEYDYELNLYLNQNINNEGSQTSSSYNQDFENNQNISNTESNDNINRTDYSNSSINKQAIDELASTLNDTINEAYSKAYHDAYIKQLKAYGYKIKYKKSFKTMVKNFFSSLLAIIFILIFLFILWQIPIIKNYFTDLYNNNHILQLIGNMFIKN